MDDCPSPTASPKRPQRSNTDFFWPKKSKDDLDEPPQRPSPHKTKSDSVVVASQSSHSKQASEGNEGKAQPLSLYSEAHIA